jgi:thioredoxin-dependent peroxiredoxin
MLKAGDVAPDFTLQDQERHVISLHSVLSKGPVVLFFYQKALSSGCTQESCHFRDLANDFVAVGAQPIGISIDEIDKQAKFAETNALNYPLLSDANSLVAKEYGVKRFGPFVNKRSTFVIDQDRHIRLAIRSEHNMNRHADAALAALRNGDDSVQIQH